MKFIHLCHSEASMHTKITVYTAYVPKVSLVKDRSNISRIHLKTGNLASGFLLVLAYSL